MKIVALTVENVKRLEAVEIKPDGSLVVIGGRNGQGKTSLLDAIMYALGGAGAMPGRPIRDGKKKATIRLDLGDLVVTRTKTAKTDKLTVTRGDGSKLSSPQAILDELTGTLTFNPLRFMEMEAGKQRDALMKVVGLDFTAHDTKRQKNYDERTLVNREFKNAQARLVAAPRHADAPEEEVSVAELSKKLRGFTEMNASNERQRQELRNLEADLEARADAIAEIEIRLGGLQAERAALEDQRQKAVKHAQAREKQIGTPEDYPLEEIHEQIRKAGDMNRLWRENGEHAVLAREVKKAEDTSSAFTNQIETLDAEKNNAIADAKFPVEGLGFGPDGVMLDGVPFEQAGGADQLRVSVAMGMALNPKLRVLLVDEGSRLDEDNLKLLAEMASEADAQVWITRVGKGKECQVVIEDGRLEENW